MKKAVKIILISLAVFIALIIAACVSVYFYIFSLFKPVNTGKLPVNEVRIEIPDGMTVSQIGKELKDKNLIKNDKLFYYSSRFPKLFDFFFVEHQEQPFILKSGIYYINDTMTIAKIQETLSTGLTEYIKISIPEGFTVSQIAQLLEDNEICSKDEFCSAAKNRDLMNSYNIPAVHDTYYIESFEGFLFPDTYFLNHNMKSEDVLKLMVNNFFEKIKNVPNLAEKNPDELYETLILASIVEREYGIPSEAPLIASVFKNRLEHNDGLYSCATIVYIITEILGRPHPDRILLADTKIDNPYNTYKWAGLTPGPISNPGLISLDAATNTPETDYYYFQVVDPATGRQEFTETFAQHKENHNYTPKKAAN